MEIVGDGRVDGVRTKPVQGTSPEGSQGTDETQERFHVAGTVIIAGEQEPGGSFAQYLAGHLKLNTGGTVWVDEEALITSRAGVFAGGDLTSGGDLVVSACADGRRAALSIDRYLRTPSRESGPEEAS